MNEPRYRTLARSLARDIAAGRRPVGSLLPTETELCAAHGVSRFTVREALRTLQEQGYVRRRQGSGTQVVAAEPSRGFVQEAGSISDMLQYARDTWLELGPARRVEAQGELAELLDSPPGREWLAFSGVRRAGEGLAICTTEIWLDTAFAELEAEVGRTREALYQLVEERYGHATEEIQQRISATLLDEAQGGALDARPGEPALRIVRRYFGAGGRVFEASVSVHPADRFAYAMRIRRGG